MAAVHRAEWQPATGSLTSMAQDLAKLRVAIVHHWFVSRRGGERVVETLAELFPQADLYALVADEKKLTPRLRHHRLTTSFVQKIPGSRRWHRYFLPFFPFALEQFDLRGYDLVISSESGPAKGVITSTRTCHVCYCHSPMRYLWDLYHQSKSENGLSGLGRLVFSLTAHYVRMWDLATAARVDYFAANSENVARRIRKHYRREATVVPPPVDFQAAYLADATEDYYLVVGHLVDYKRVDLAIEACNRLQRPLRIVGQGEQYKRLKRLAGPTVSFLGPLNVADLREQYAHCRALLFPGEEDFGIVPVEAQSFGRPVIAYGCGGVLETVSGFYPGEAPVERPTGVFFRQQSADALVEAILVSEEEESVFSPTFIRSHVEQFDVSHFKSRISAFIAEKYEEFQSIDRRTPESLCRSVGAP